MTSGEVFGLVGADIGNFIGLVAVHLTILGLCFEWWVGGYEDHHKRDMPSVLVWCVVVFGPAAFLLLGIPVMAAIFLFRFAARCHVETE